MERAPTLPNKYLRKCKVLAERRDILQYLPRNIVFVEIGVALGDYTAVILEVCSIKHFYAVDIFNLHEFPQAWGGRVGEVLGGLDHRSFYERRFSAEIAAGRMTLLEGDSRAKLEEMSDRSIDVAYVDANHSYEPVKAELAVLRRKMAPGGTIIMNDYTVFDQYAMAPYGVPRAAHEFMLDAGWEMTYLALSPEMFCDIAIRERRPRSLMFWKN